MTAGELALIVAPALWYAAGVRALWSRAGMGHGVSRAQACSFAGGIATLVLALGPPLDEMADATFAAHMVQHMLLMLVAAPLLVLGAPLVPALWALPAHRRRSVGRWWLAAGRVRGTVHALTAPGVVFALQLVSLWLWHLPVPYRAALESPAVHALEHLTFLGSASLFWWVVATPVGRRRAHEGVALLLIAGTLMHSGALGAVLMLARSPWYPEHAAGVAAAGTTLLADQQLAALIMWVPGGAVYVAAAAWVFVRWLRRDERDGRQRIAPPAARGLWPLESV